MATTESARASRLKEMGRAFADRNYRLFFIGQGISLIGTWMTRLATGWLVFRASGADASFLLGVVSFASLAPAFFVGPLAGVLVDRWNRHHVLIATQILSMAQSAALAWVALAAEPGMETVWLVAGLSIFQGIVNSLDMPARQSLLIEMVSQREDLPNAIALNSSLVNGSRLIGPAIAGLVIAGAGEAWCFIIDAVSYGAVVAALLLMRLRPREWSPHRASVGRSFLEGIQYAYGFPTIRWLLLLLALVSFAAMPYSVLLPIFAADILHGGPHVLGLLSASSGLGAFAGAIYLASRPSVLGLGRVIVASTTFLAFALAGFSQSRLIWLSCGLLAVAGAGMMVQMAAINTLIQTLVSEDKRGRVMGLYSMAFQGAAPFGSLLAGWLAGKVGVQVVVLGSGVLVFAGMLVFAVQLPRLRTQVRPIYIKMGILAENTSGVGEWPQPTH